MPGRNLIHYCPELGLLRLVNDIRRVYTDQLFVGGYHYHVQVINLFKFLLLCLGCAGHAGKLVIHSEIILECNRSESLGLPFDFNIFLGLNGLMQSFAIPPAKHQPAGKLIHDDHLAVFHHIIAVPFHQGIGLKSLVQVVSKLDILVIIKVGHADRLFHLGHACFGDSHCMRLFVNGIVGFRGQTGHDPGKYIV
ncbi:MAG: hypothetical protein BWY65_00616 [Firmicutes bacterium ADurb.Bin373]|nr:MAG: hypothetical protein BWY65_00616 [Firmicutes bacterium ADurb.Bin373]